MPEKIEIYAKYEGYGWVAKSPDTKQTSPRCSGPRQAAEKLAVAVFGEGNYQLTRRSYRIYLASKI